MIFGHESAMSKLYSRRDFLRAALAAGASDTSAWPCVPGDFDRRPADPRGGPRYCSGHADDGPHPDRFRRRQSRTFAEQLAAIPRATSNREQDLMSLVCRHARMILF